MPESSDSEKGAVGGTPVRELSGDPPTLGKKRIRRRKVLLKTRGRAHAGQRRGATTVKKRRVQWTLVPRRQKPKKEIQ